jgi:2',3'-cyclic-nucleotide 2'-phosphodiesterase (5'-nucleotidase family)
MNRLGLEFNAVGNHEFDDGKAELLRMQNGGCHPTDTGSCQGARVGTPVPFEGAKFKFLSANVVDTATGETLFPPYGVKGFKGHRIAFIGMTLQDTPSIVTPTGVAGLEFRDEADTVNALVPKLRKQGVKAIVVLVHQGGFQGASSSPPGTPPDNFINDCKEALLDPSTSPIKDIVSRLDNAVDVVISGHTVQPFGNTLVTMTLTAQQLKNFLEQQFTGCAIPGEPAQTADRILQVSSGFKFAWSAAAPPCSKITAASLDGADIVLNGALVVAPATTYRVTVNNFIATGGDGFTVLKQGTTLLGGAQDIDALVAYFADFKAPNPPYDPNAPTLNKPRITRLP